jgi:hypothetical protein
MPESGLPRDTIDALADRRIATELRRGVPQLADGQVCYCPRLWVAA